MRSRILRALLILGLVVGSVAAASNASAYFIDSPRVAVVAADPSAIGAVACINGLDPHHNVKVFWEPGRVCPTGHYGIADAFTSGTGTAGPQGPKGDKGDPGDSVAKVATKAVTLTASSPATQTVVLTGLPAHSSSVVELAVNNAGEAPSGTTVTVTAVTPAAGSTERSFTVAAAGFTGSQTFALSVKVLAVSA